jgi:hypothetical protein
MYGGIIIIDLYLYREVPIEHHKSSHLQLILSVNQLEEIDNPGHCILAYGLLVELQDLVL